MNVRMAIIMYIFQTSMGGTVILSIRISVLLTVRLTTVTMIRTAYMGEAIVISHGLRTPRTAVGGGIDSQSIKQTIAQIIKYTITRRRANVNPPKKSLAGMGFPILIIW